MVRYRYSREPVPLIPGPAYPKGNSLFGYRYLAYKQDQGSVLAVRVFGSLSIYFTPQLEVDLVNDLLRWEINTHSSKDISYILLDKGFVKW